MMRAFRGFRPEPPEEYKAGGLTNAGETADYEGVVWSDGTVSVRWLTAYRSHVVWPDYETFYAVHGHPEYGTRIEWYEVGMRSSGDG